MSDTRTESPLTAALKRYQLTIPEELVNDATPVMRERHVRSFSDYVTRLIQEDILRTRSGKHPQSA